MAAVATLDEDPWPHDGPVLTSRQEEVLRLVQEGLANKQIGRRLGISEGTVRKHLEHILGRLGVRSRTAAVAVRLGGWEPGA